MTSNVKIDMPSLFEAGVHFGHMTKYRHPAMNTFIHTSRNKIHIINLDETRKGFQAALDFLHKVGERGGKALFVGTKYPAKKIVAEKCKEMGMPYVDNRWLGGTLTNFSTITNSVKHMFRLIKQKEDGTFDKLTKKEALLKTRELTKLERALGGIRDMNSLPDVLFVIDANYEKIAIKEANRLKIPVVAIVDTNSDPSGVDYVIPGNDDSMRAIELYMRKASEALQSGKKAAQNRAAKNPKEEVVEIVEEATASPADASQATPKERDQLKESKK